MKCARQTGFTLLELMFTLAVAGIVLGIGVPSFKEFVRSNAMSSAANNLVTSLLFARAEAVKRHAPVTVCASADATAASPSCSSTGAGNGAFIVFVDNNDEDLNDSTDGNAKVDSGETVLRVQTAPGGQINVWSDGGHYVTYGANGFKIKAQGASDDSATEILLCDDRGNTDRGGISTARLVKIDWLGRGQVVSAHDEITTAASAISGASCPG